MKVFKLTLDAIQSGLSIWLTIAHALDLFEGEDLFFNSLGMIGWAIIFVSVSRDGYLNMKN